jgi:large subunit ribosomal protein L10
MKLTKSQKIEKAKDLGTVLSKAPSIFFTEFQGIKFTELDTLRGKLRPLRCKYTVMKNSLVRNALKNAGIDGIDPKLLKGPIGLVVADSDDPAGAAKVLSAFAKDVPLLKVKAGFVGGNWMTASECAKLATLGTKPELLSKLAGTLYASVAQTAGVLQAPIRDFVLVLSALEDKKKKESPAAA